MKITTVILLFIFASIILSCKGNKYDINTASIELPLTFINMDSMLFNANQTDYLAIREVQMKQNGDLFSYNLSYCLGIKLYPNATYQKGLSNFYRDKYIQNLEKSIETNFNKSNRQEKEIHYAFKRMKFHFPNQDLPVKIAYVNSLFSASINCGEDYIAIGLDRYLGRDEKVIKQLPTQEFFLWIKEGMDRKYLSRDAVLAWLMSHYIEETSENYSSEMIRWGKLIFITHACLPELEDEILLRYSKKDLEWARNSEASFWKYLVKEEMLFKTDEESKLNLLHEGPFTIGLPDKSPDRMGVYLGYSIVSQYMNNNDISLKQLINLPYNTILQGYEAQ